MKSELNVGFTVSGNYKCLEDLKRSMLDLHMRYCGWEQCSSGDSWGFEKRENYVLHYVLGGKGSFKMDGKRWELKKDDVFLILPEIETFYQADEEEPWQYLWIGFSGLSAEECVKSIGLSKEKPTGSYTCGENLRGIIQQILNAHELTFENELLRTALLMEFLAVLIKDQNRRFPKAKKKGQAKDYSNEMYVWYAMDYMKSHYSEKIKISDLADYIGITRGYLTDSFKKFIHLSPQEFLLQLRMDRAVELLRDTELPVHKIAGQVGYDDPLTFSKRFNQRFGMSPTQYREQKPELVLGNDKLDYMPKLPL